MVVPRPSVLTTLVDTLLPATPRVGTRPAYPSGSSVGVDRDISDLIEGLPEGARSEFGAFLRALDSRVANLLLSGRPVRFSHLSPSAREAFLRSWSTSRLAVKRKGFHAVRRLATGLYYSRPTEGATHPLWTRIGYEPPAPPADAVDPLAAFAPVRPSADVEEHADVCVVGSGAGGSVIAERVARAGYRVVVLEAGAWTPPPSYPRLERDGHDRLFLGRGVVTTSDYAFGLLAGETVGGSTAINWMTCLPPRPEARAEWARDGLEGADGPDLERRLAAVGERLSVSTTESEVNPSNDALRRGAIALGYREGTDWGIIPRNARGCRERCGFCTFGCPYSTRRSTLVTYLAEALAHGARLYASTKADLVEVEGGRAVGVRATFRGEGRTHGVRVRARAVVVAGGALETPALLLRSGLRGPGVGVGLRLDPTTAMAGEFDRPVRTWVGPHQTVGVYRFQTSDVGAHGPWIEVAPAHPGLSALAIPWHDAADHRRLLERVDRVATPIVLVRDVGEGRVRVDAAGRPIYDYRLTDRDRTNLVRGLVETARILRAAGATRLLSLHTPYVEVGTGSAPVTAAELDRFVEQVRSAGIHENRVALFSAHPMGSARAGRDPRRSAARPTGELWGVDGVWVGDGSLLPSAPGANPMMSILALASRTADGLVASLGGERGSLPTSG